MKYLLLILAASMVAALAVGCSNSDGSPTGPGSFNSSGNITAMSQRDTDGDGIIDTQDADDDDDGVPDDMDDDDDNDGTLDDDEEDYDNDGTIDDHDDDCYEIEGRLVAIDGDIITVHEWEITTTDQTRFEDEAGNYGTIDILQVGMWVEVEAVVNAEGDYVAKEVEIEDEEDDDHNVALADLQVGEFVEVEAGQSGSMLVIRQINREPTASVYEYEALVESVSASGVTLVGLSLEIDGNTVFDGTSLGTLAEGDYVEVDAIPVDGGYRALKIDAQEEAFVEIEVRAAVEAVDIVEGRVTVGGVEFHTN